MILGVDNICKVFEIGEGDENFVALVSYTVILVVVIAAIMVWRFLVAVRSRRLSGHTMVSSCPNPNCIRCRRYRQIQSSARSRLPWVVSQVRERHPGDSLERLCDSIRSPREYATKFQHPTVLMVRDLPSQSVITKMHHHFVDPYVSTLLANTCSLEVVLLEIRQVESKLWNRNDTPGGSWEVLPLLNQGNWNAEILSRCPRLTELVKNIPGLLDGCLFGNVMVSKIHAGTTIEPHCGPTNARHRLQYTLRVPGDSNPESKVSEDSNLPYLVVGENTRLTWNRAGDFFVFDDSFLHAVHYHYDKSSLDQENDSFRMVLIVDLWHPDLTLGERTLIRHMYPPFYLPPDSRKKEA